MSSGNSFRVSTTSPARSPQADDDDDVHVGVPARHLLEHRLAGAEGARDAVGAALRDGEEGVDGPRLRHHGLGGLETLDVAVDRALDRPGEDHGDGRDRAALVGELGHRLVDAVLALGLHALHGVGAVEAEGHHDAVGEGLLRHRAEGVSALHLVARLHAGAEAPLPVAGKRLEVDARLEEVAGPGRHEGQGILQAVVDLAEEARPELDGEELARELDRVPYLDALGHLVDLGLGDVPADADDLALQPLFIEMDIGDFVHGNGALDPDAHHVSVDAGHLSCGLGHCRTPVSLDDCAGLKMAAYTSRYSFSPRSGRKSATLSNTCSSRR